MIVSSKFKNDNNERTMWLQHDRYALLVVELFKTARRKYLSAEIMLDVVTDLGSIVKSIDGFDHRTLQEAHDIIAASFRLNYVDQLDPELPFPDQESDEVRVTRLWCDYYYKEIDLLTDIPQFTKSVLRAVAFPNTDTNDEAEDAIKEILTTQYEGKIS